MCFFKGGEFAFEVINSVFKKKKKRNCQGCEGLRNLDHVVNVFEREMRFFRT